MQGWQAGARNPSTQSQSVGAHPEEGGLEDWPLGGTPFKTP